MSVVWGFSRGGGTVIIITSRFEAARELFLDGPRNFEPKSDDEDAISAGTFSPNFRARPAGGRLAPAYDLACSRPSARRILGGIGFRAWSPPIPKLRHCH
ncbi:hypothetical protein AVEN_64137-1 [Araneus ventricosus]|uniref:Uncharacterized protein n=1 Tax=Araneus ventricosus TaxID=182803 RepID=A0A4Y2C5V3_ARAVE|nr:hypothetical protein AVEN_64137-1 [Araneus ventricosus]